MLTLITTGLVVAGVAGVVGGGWLIGRGGFLNTVCGMQLMGNALSLLGEVVGGIISAIAE